jgi:hypothetical protein
VSLFSTVLSVADNGQISTLRTMLTVCSFQRVYSVQFPFVILLNVATVSSSDTPCYLMYRTLNCSDIDVILLICCTWEFAIAARRPSCYE